MDFPIHVDTISNGLCTCHRREPLNYFNFCSLDIVLIIANSEIPDKMLHDAAFHLGFYVLPKNCSSFSSMKGVKYGLTS